MKKLLPLLLLLTGCFQLPRPVETVQPQSTVQEAISDVVALVSEDGFVYCSGVITEGVLLTAAHCIDDGEQKEAIVAWRGIEDNPVGSMDVRLVEVDVTHDLAIMQGITKQFRHGRSLAPYAPVEGERAIAVGHPLGLTWSLTEGLVVKPRRCLWQRWPVCMMQTSIPLAPGNSGGAIYNKYGEVIGIASFLMTGYPHLTGATAWLDIKNLMEKVKE